MAISTAAALLQLAVGALFMFLAWKQWRKRPRRGEELEMPTWMTSIESTTAPKALVLGAVLSGANPKNFALTLVAAALVAETGLDETSTAIVLAIFVLLGSITVAGAVLFHLVAPRSGAATRQSQKVHGGQRHRDDDRDTSPTRVQHPRRWDLRSALNGWTHSQPSNLTETPRTCGGSR